MSRSQQPTCFSKLWDTKAIECIGGVDPAFTDVNGRHVREPCGFFEACGARRQAEAQAGLVPPHHLTRFTPTPQPPAPPPVQTALAPTPGLTAAQAQLLQQLLQQAQYPNSRPAAPMIPAPSYTPAPMMYPSATHQPMMPVNFQIPQYLSVREERELDEGVWPLLGRELLRSMGKSLGHTLANFFDTTAFRRMR